MNAVSWLTRRWRPPTARPWAPSTCAPSRKVQRVVAPGRAAAAAATDLRPRAARRLFDTGLRAPRYSGCALSRRTRAWLWCFIVSMALALAWVRDARAQRIGANDAEVEPLIQGVFESD